MARTPLLVLAFLVFTGPAAAVTITRNFTAAWYDPAHAGHGFNVEVIDNAAGKTLGLYWYTYDANGAPLWILAIGPVDGNRATLNAVTTSGGRFGNSFDPAQLQTRAWGTMEIEFSDCNNGVVRWSPIDTAFAAGSMPIVRLSQLFGSACTGGISDDTGSVLSGGASEIFLANTGVVPQANARTRFEQLADRTEFQVELEDLPVGPYTLRVGDEARATINVVAVTGGTEGEVEFRSPVEPGKILLDFDPRGQDIRIVQGATVFFGSTLPTAPTTPTQPPQTGNPPPTGNALYSLHVEPQGNDGPELSADLEQRADRVEFHVELEDVAAGTYTIRVGGSERGEANVVAVPGGTHGELEFRNPVEPGKVLLDFDPRGALIEAVRNGVVVISGTLPSQPNGTPTDGVSTGGTVTPPPPPPGTGNTLIEVALISSGLDPDANGHAAYEQTANEREFEVQIEDVPDGNYTLTVGSLPRATIPVSDGRGEVKFNAPAREGRILLDFDPRGQRIEVTGGGALYLSVDFPI